MFHSSESQGNLRWGIEYFEGYTLVLGYLNDHLGVLEDEVWAVYSCPT